MEEVIYIEDIKEAAPVGWNGSYADEGNCQSYWLPITVMSSHVNLSAIDHSEMTSDINRFPGCLLALCAKALSKAKRIMDFYYHIDMIDLLLESLERLVKSTSSAFIQTKGASTKIADTPCRLALDSPSNHIF